MQMLEAKWAEGKFVCVGLDSEFGKIPPRTPVPPELAGASIVHGRMFGFNRQIVRATHDLVCAYKINTAFYEAEGVDGISALKWTVSDIREAAPDVPVILDAKRADIGNTNAGYVKFAFDFLQADAITVHPYLGQEALQPFLDCKDKGVIVLCRTSNPGAGEFQDLVQKDDRPLYKHVAERVAQHWNKNGNCCLVVGATYPHELAHVRKIIGNMPILIPGVGAQGGDVEQAVRLGMTLPKRDGFIINSSRGIIFASDPRVEMQKLHDQIKACLGS